MHKIDNQQGLLQEIDIDTIDNLSDDYGIYFCELSDNNQINETLGIIDYGHMSDDHGFDEENYTNWYDNI